MFICAVYVWTVKNLLSNNLKLHRSVLHGAHQVIDYWLMDVQHHFRSVHQSACCIVASVSERTDVSPHTWEIQYRLKQQAVSSLGCIVVHPAAGSNTCIDWAGQIETFNYSHENKENLIISWNKLTV